MPILTALAGAMFLTWAGSRIALAVLRDRIGRVPMILLAHLLSFLAIALFVGLLKAHVQAFRPDAMLIYILPQLIWAALDIVTYPQSRRYR